MVIAGVTVVVSWCSVVGGFGVEEDEWTVCLAKRGERGWLVCRKGRMAQALAQS